MGKHRNGVFLVMVSAVVFSMAGIFTKGVMADAWSVIFWRGLSAAGFTLVYLALRQGFADEWRRWGWPAVLSMLFNASGTAAFIPAFKLTSVANVALIWAAAPFVAALLAWLALRERPGRRVMLASAVTLAGVLIVISGSFEGSHLAGDALALWMTVMMGGVMVVYRKWPETPVALPNAGASLLLLPVSALFSAPFQVTVPEISVLLLFGLVFAVASVTFTEGARRIPAAETALLGALETPLAPFWAYLLLAEIPTMQTMVGGGLILFAVVWSQRGD